MLKESKAKRIVLILYLQLFPLLRITTAFVRWPQRIVCSVGQTGKVGVKDYGKERIKLGGLISFAKSGNMKNEISM